MLPSGILYSTKSIQRSAFMKRRYVPRLVPNYCAAVEMHGSVLNDAMSIFSIETSLAVQSIEARSTWDTGGAYLRHSRNTIRSFGVSHSDGRPPTPSNSIPCSSPLRLRRQPSHGLLIRLRLPFYRYLIYMFLPECHLLAFLQSNPIRHPVRVSSDPPERAVFDFGDLKVDGLSALSVGVLYDDADDAGGEEVADCLGRENDAVPVSDGVLTDWGEGAWHGSGRVFCYGETQ